MSKGVGPDPRRGAAHDESPDAAAVDALARCLAGGGVALIPTDTVYGLACVARDAGAFARIHVLKGREPAKPAAVMFFALDDALAALPELDEVTRMALRALLPGPVTALVPNPARRFPLACGPTPEILGLRVPRLGGALAALAGPREPLLREPRPCEPLLQTSANLSGGRDPRRLADVPASIMRGVDVVLDGGTLPGTPSTVVDLSALAGSGRWSLLREGAVAHAEIARALAAAGG